MNLRDHYIQKTIGKNYDGKDIINEDINWLIVIRDVVILFLFLFIFIICWPFYTVPTGSRGVVTQFGKIIGIEAEGLTILPPWQKLSNFSIRAETADIKDAKGSTSDTQPVHVSMTVRYSIMIDKVAEVFS